MKKIFVFLILALFIVGFTDCVRAKKGCKQNHRKIEKMRKNNPNFKV